MGNVGCSESGGLQKERVPSEGAVINRENHPHGRSLNEGLLLVRGTAARRSVRNFWPRFQSRAPSEIRAASTCAPYSRRRRAAATLRLLTPEDE